eukprot:CAMPEP_0201551816 /NCGR_PEP_ID=MMETSP0173_2-20130828/10523_1 /ASSEMBLY_ACC=CAM_ASM_000268 /TAXON_ID=218659 /ORGANISM="Vexillifera sp., Strain DIVA3 564/2" /LENGTH=239 /DNA_ID=CAMNT_0047962161 /DNA_START=1 /DNA_END=720 /DNA_ORIENTATION=+
MADAGRWFAEIPLITKTLVFGSLGLSVLGYYGIIPPLYLFLSYPFAIEKFQIWRFVSAAFWVEKIGFPYLVNLVFLYKHSSQLEKFEFAGRQADYLFFLLFSGFFLTLVGLAFPFYSTFLGLLFAILYYWSRKFEDVDVKFWFGISFKGRWLPWALLVLNMLLGRGIPFRQLAGIICAHIYYFLTTVYPVSTNSRPLISTPWFLYKLFPNDQPPSSVVQNYSTHLSDQFQGQARTLGGH